MSDAASQSAWLQRLAETDPEAAALMAARPPVQVTPIDPRFLWIWRAWHRLHPDRPMHPVGMGAPLPGAIAWRDVIAWSDRHGYGDDQVELLDATLQKMDAVFLAREVDRRKIPEASPGNPSHRAR